MADLYFNEESDYSEENTCDFMAPFYGWGSAASRLQSHYREVVYFLPQSSQKFLVLI